jgi:hypothetical protein
MTTENYSYLNSKNTSNPIKTSGYLPLKTLPAIQAGRHSQGLLETGSSAYLSAILILRT